jgi:hypothetical protein
MLTRRQPEYLATLVYIIESKYRRLKSQTGSDLVNAINQIFSIPSRTSESDGTTHSRRHSSFTVLSREAPIGSIIVARNGRQGGHH